MQVLYELFDLATGSVIDDFATGEDALEALRATKHEYGLAAISDVALLRYDDDQPTLDAMEHDLVARVAKPVVAERLRIG